MSNVFTSFITFILFLWIPSVYPQLTFNVMTSSSLTNGVCGKCMWGLSVGVCELLTLVLLICTYG